MKPILVILSGLPGVGKTTIAKLLANQLCAAYLRIDTIEQALIESGVPRDSISVEGYLVGYRLASANLLLGLSVVADSVNPIEITRSAWENAATSSDAAFLNVEVICSNVDVHEARVTTRKADIPGFKLPTWQEVVDREYEPWTRNVLKIDTAFLSPERSVELVLSSIN